MNAFLGGPGFLGTGATFRSDATLVLILVSAALFIFGWRLALQKRFDTHRWVQTMAVIISSIAALATMVASFWIYILPGIPAKLGEGPYGITTCTA
jgi:hypothetical protein